MTETFLKQFEEHFAGAGRTGSWLDRLRLSGIHSFGELGFPTTDLEDWRYTSLEAMKSVPFELASASDAGGRIESDFVERSAFYTKEDVRLVFVNGIFSPDLSAAKGLPQGAILGSLSSAIQKNPSVIEKHLSQSAAYKNRALVALNTAFFRDGAFLSLPAGTVVERPIFICHLSWNEKRGRPTVSHPRNLIVMGENAKATIVEIYMGGGDEVYFTNAVTEIVTAQGAIVDHYKLQQESGNAYHIGSIDVRQERDCRFDSLSISLGASLARTEVNAVLAAEGATCALNGLFMVTGRQHVDNQTSIDHAKPNGTSTELYKGILSGQSRGVFNGKIVVRPHAQKTNARQTNKNLILSEEALMNTKPLLEIYANDVKCNHGATIGRLDENQVFYLRSRGMAETHARSLLTYAFASDLVGRIQVASFQKAMEKWIFRRLLASDLTDREALL